MRYGYYIISTPLMLQYIIFLVELLGIPSGWYPLLSMPSAAKRAAAAQIQAR